MAGIPADDLGRRLALSDVNDPGLPSVAVAGGVYTILVSGAQTAGRYCLIDMLVPPGSGPPPHRHDFEEMFTVLEGEITLNFRGEVLQGGVGTSVNVPANAPHSFKNNADKPLHLLCMCTPAGQDAFFLAVGDKVASRDVPPPELSEAEKAERGTKAKKLAGEFKTELLV
jgi:quercetin dioxygenase-like cupin family protein